MYIGAGKGATAYEIQIGRVYVRWTHLTGGPWRWRPWRRLSVRILPRED